MLLQRLRHYATTFDGDKLEFTATIPGAGLLAAQFIAHPRRVATLRTLPASSSCCLSQCLYADDCSAVDVEIMLSHQRLDLRIRNESLLVRLYAASEG